MKLVVLGVEQDSTKELELFPENKELGFNVAFRYITPRFRDRKAETFHNVTEFHHLYDSTSIACESHIHGTGFGGHDWVKNVSSIVVTHATKVHRSF